ncbi:hypothetical protein C0J50_7369 [Silurus asotus]|uniref:Rab11 family-interacting protein 5 n=1 Tax=Silurus asotus TaxID=30991 RepID=A0AAD4ZZN8_SILAS|nr:hypothetical protein C0J50_7369 [Silurus asotus]
MASVNRDEEQRWVPTHVQVLVIRARGLRAKGKHGTSDAYAVVQLGKEKYSTCVMEKTTEPEWGEECSFELQPGVLEEGGRDALPAGTCDLTFTVMHRALIGLDVFLGQSVIAVDKAFRERACMRNEWYKLNSKTGKKEKERGELQLTVQFTRHNLTASMYDLSLKDKPRSAFIRLRERMRARKHGGDEESSSAVVPGGYGTLTRSRSRLPSDGGGEEDYEDDEGGELRRSKMRSYFLHGRLRKSSDTRSSTSLGSESSESSSRGGSLSPTAGISVVVSDLSNSPSNSSNLTADNSPEHTVAPSPLVSPVKSVFDEVCDFSISVPHSLTTDIDAPILLPSVCVNGNPVETSPLTHQPPSLVLQQPRLQIETQQESQQTPQSSPPGKSKSTQAQTAQLSEIKPQYSSEFQTQQPKVESKSKPDVQFPALGLLQKGSALSLSLQNLSRRKEKQQGGGPVDGRRWSFDKPGEEEKAAIAAALEHAGLIADEPVIEKVASVSERDVQGKKKRSLFSHTRGEKEESGPVQPAAEGRHRGWFSSKDPYSKPSQLVAPQTDFPASRACPLLSLCPTDFSEDMPYQHTNPFTSTSFISPANPFFSLLKQNPFFQELHTVTPLTPSLPFFCSSSIDQPEVPASRPRSHTPPLHLDEAGNAKGALMDESSDNLTSSFCRTNVSGDSYKYTQWDDFIDGRLKLNSKINTQMLNVLTSSCSIEPTNPTPTCAEGDLQSHVEAKFVHCSMQKVDLCEFVPLDALESEIDSSLPQNSSIEFSELNALACPYPTLPEFTINNDKFSAISFFQKNTSNAMPVSSVTLEPSALNSDLPGYLARGEKSEDKTRKSMSSERQTDDDAKWFVEIRNTSLSYSNFDILEEPSIVAPDSPSRSCIVPKSLPKEQKNFKSEGDIGTGDGDLELAASPIKERTCLDVVPATDTLGLSIPLGPSVSVLHGKLTIEKDPTGNPACEPMNKSEVNFEGEGFHRKNLNVLMDSASTYSSNMSLEKDKFSDSSSNLSKGFFKNNSLPETVLKHCEVETPKGNRNIPSSPHSPKNVLSDSLYKSVDSEQYLTCMSQHTSLAVSQFSPVAPLENYTFQEANLKSDLTQDILTTNDFSQRTILKLQQDPAEISQKALPKMLKFTKCVASQNTLEKEVIMDTVANGSIQKYNPPMDSVMKQDLLHESMPDVLDMMPKAGENLLMLDSYMYRDDISSALPHRFHQVQCSDALKDLELITDFCQSPENMCNSDFAFKPNSSIIHDLVKTDLPLENVFVAQHAVTHSVGTSPVAFPAPRETFTNMELCLEVSQRIKNAQETSTTAFVSQGEYLDIDVNWSTSQPPPPEPSVLGRPTSGHDQLMSSPLSLLDLSPLAASTPHVAEENTSMPLFPFPVPAVTAKLQHTALATDAFPTLLAASHNSFPQKERQVDGHLSSPHLVKPLTPPDEKRSEGRSVLEKLKSTIHPGRSHQGDQEPDKKLLVEGGGSYYHLNHSELVSLLLQRDAELQHEREEYERSGLLLEKREMEIKKMRVLIKDLEDYIDTLLVRIMEQTPALLQVRSKIK